MSLKENVQKHDYCMSSVPEVGGCLIDAPDPVKIIIIMINSPITTLTHT